MEILASRMLLRPADYQRSLSFYRDQIGLAIAREYRAGTVFSPASRCLNWPGILSRATRTTPGAPFPARCGCRCAISRRPRPSWPAGVPITREARQEPWGLREMHVTDPDGITLIFVQVPEDHPLRVDTRLRTPPNVG